MGLTLEACVNETCAFKMPIFNNSEIPGSRFMCPKIGPQSSVLFLMFCYIRGIHIEIAKVRGYHVLWYSDNRVVL